MPRMPIFIATALLSAASATLPAFAEGMMKHGEAAIKNEMSNSNASMAECRDAMAKDGMAKTGCNDDMSRESMSKDAMSKDGAATNNMMAPPK